MFNQPERAPTNEGPDTSRAKATTLATGEDYVIIQVPRKTHKGAPKRRITALSNAIMLETIAYDAYTTTQIAGWVGLSVKTVADYMAALHRRKMVYIESWGPSRQGCPSTAKWRLGMRKKDAPKPPPLTPAQRQKNSRIRKRGLPSVPA